MLITVAGAIQQCSMLITVARDMQQCLMLITVAGSMQQCLVLITTADSVKRKKRIGVNPKADHDVLELFQQDYLPI